MASSSHAPINPSSTVIPPFNHANHPAATSGSSNNSTPTARSTTDTTRFNSMGGAAQAMATGGQAHAHRPVSAMPTPTQSHSSNHNHNHYSSSHQSQQSSGNSQSGSASQSSATAGDVFASAAGMNPAYSDRRASAHPTMSSNSSNAASSSTPVASIPSTPSALDATSRSALSSGIPLTSPAALSYFAAHPRRQQVHFGSYLLLQTLGEGEFGKVKLGVHKEWGEEVAVKLIKRDKVASDGTAPLPLSDGKDPVKMSKVEREIQVLKDVRHPNIVRLYEVIESDRYIGIVLEYASGGELFDHILAHKYLKERDAVRLFAQLISGVSYLHQKKIVHRDLKLENLLLDRNRNVIITDFGFANNFESRRDDLMATSCGSPCYAAPELVVQDGLYAGSAVDVWSCGVILYAMLAGYLPFDDDPQNPDGDNINLLYKYIMATPLSFPDYITAQPRDLLSKMLVPDPLRRADLKGVMGHSWLAAYRDLFNFSVQELESAAFEQQTKKRQAYRQQMMVQHQMQEQQKHQQQQQQQLARSQTTRGAGITTGGVNPVDALSPNNSQSTKSQRHHSAMATPSAMPERMYESSSAIASSAGSGASSGAAVSRSRPVTGMPTPTSSAAKAGDQPLGSLNSPHSHFDAITAQGEARGEPRTRVEDGYVSSSRNANPPTASERKVREAEAAAAKIPSAQKVQRHTIQLEYEEPERSTRREPRNNGTSEATAPPPVPKVARQDSTSAANATPVVVPSHEKAIEQKTSKTSDVLTGIPSPIMETKSPSASPTVVPSASIPQQESSETDSARASLGAGRPSSSTSRGASNPLPQVGSENVPFPDPNANGTTNGRVVSVGGGPTRKSTTTSKSQLEAINSNGKSSTPEKSSRHRKGMSTDKFFFSRLLGSSPNVANSAASEPLGPRASLAAARSPDAQSHPGGDMQRQASNNSGKGSAGSRRKAVSLVMGRPGESSPAVREKDKANAAAKAAKEERRLTGRARKDTANSQNQMPPPSTPKTSNGPTGSVLSTSGQSTASTNAGSRRQPSDASSRPAPTSGASVASGSVRAPSSHALFDNEGANDSTSTVGPSSSAAKKVMDWFRKKSLSKGSGFAEQPPLGPFVHHSPSANPSVIVTNTANGSPHANGNGVAANGTEPDSGPSSRSTSGTHSQISNATDTTGMTSEASGTISSNRSGAPVKSSILGEQQPTPRASTALMSNAASEAPPSSVGAFSNSTSRSGASSFNDTSLRFHLGAVDQTALTSRPPPLVLASVKSALYEMGIEVRKEKDEDFKLDCVRKKRAKTLMGATAGLGLSIRTSVFPPTQNDYEKSSMTRSPTSPNNAGDQPMSPSASSGPGGSIRNFLRRGSQQTGVNHAGSPPSATSALPDEWDRNGNQPTPLYGEASVDGGQEVRFSVEVTKIKNLPGLYSLDIRRMKGNLWAYKFLYHALLERSQLASTATA